MPSSGSNHDGNPSPTHPPGSPTAPMISIEDDEGEYEEDSGSTTSSSSYSSSSESSSEEEDEEELNRQYAEQVKLYVQRQVKELKKVYDAIKERNKTLPEKLQLKPESLHLPKEIYASTFDKIESECGDVYRSHEYQAAETLLQLEKVHEFYFQDIETPHLVVKDVTHQLQIHSIRSRKVISEFHHLIEKNIKQLMEEYHHEDHTHVMEAEVKHEAEPVKRVLAKDIIGDYESMLDVIPVDVVHQIRHLERLLDQKYERELAWQDLQKNKIPVDYIPPQDMERLEQAQKHTGAYRLQTSDAYVAERVTLAQRRQRIIDIKLKMREESIVFNRLVFEARDEKPKVIQECRRLQREIRRVQVVLPEEYRRTIPPIYDMEPDEMPEKFFDISVQEEEQLEKKLLEEAGLEHVEKEIQKDFFGVKEEEKKVPWEVPENKVYVPPIAPPRTPKQAKAIDLEFESIVSYRCRRLLSQAQSDVEKKNFEIKFYPRMYRQELLFKELHRVIDYFHERIKFLHDMRVKLEIESKIKHIGLLSLISELDVAKEFHGQEESISMILKVQRTEIRHAKRHLEKLRKHLVIINDNIKKCEETQGSVNKDVDRVIGENRFRDFLFKVYRKSIAMDEEEEEESKRPSSSDQGSVPKRKSSRRSSSPSPTRKKVLDIRPEDCEEYVFNKMLEHRERRIRIEREIEKAKKLGEQTSLEYVSTESRIQKYQERINELSEELRILQRRRQKKMNDLKIAVILRMDQIQGMGLEELTDVDREILDKLTQSFPGSENVVIFPKGGSHKLEQRAAELVKKGKAELEKLRRVQNMLARLRQEVRKAEKEVELLRSQVKEEMIKKFGQEVDLDKACASLINLELIQEEKKLQKTKDDQYAEKAVILKQLDKIKDELRKQMEENSKLNMLHAVMLERKRDLEYYIWKHEKQGQVTQTEGEGDGEMAGAEASETGDQKSSDTQLSGPTCAESSVGFDYTQLEKDIHDAKTILGKQESRIKELKVVLAQCRNKSTVPPLVLPKQCHPCS